MLDKMHLMLHAAFIPFKDLLFAQNKVLVETALAIHNHTKERTKLGDLFKEKVYRALLSQCAPSSLDEIDLYMEKFHPYLFRKYFQELKMDEARMERKLYNHYSGLLKEFARALLSHRDGEMVFKYWKHERSDSDTPYVDVWDAYTELDKVHMFSMLSRIIPMDLLIASYYTANKLTDPLQLNGLFQHINLADAPLHDVLRNGVAENHLHASAAFTFSMLWQQCMNFNGKFAKSRIGGYLENFKSSLTCHSEQIKEYILTAHIIRLVLARYMESGETKPISSWISKNYPNAQKIISICFDESQFASVVDLSECLVKLNNEFGNEEQEDGNDWILLVFKKLATIKTYGENIYLHQVMQYIKQLEENNAKDKVFNEFMFMFFRYIRIKNEFYQQVNQSKTLNGLDYFQEYFSRATKGFDNQDDSYYLDMLRNLFQNQYLKKVEFRLSISNTDATNRGRILKILVAYKQILDEDYNVNDNMESKFPRLGIVYHLKKEKDESDKDWTVFRDDDKRVKALHFGQIQKQYKTKVQSILNLRNRIPYLSNFIVGLDAASLENNTPIHVFAPVFETARNSDHDKMLTIDRNAAITKQQSMFFTFHAGEDFRHLNSGLRRIDEVIDFCKFHSGDRIGHGIALGVSVEDWVSENRIIIIPRGEYLDNLLWIWGVYTRVSDVNFKTYSYLQHKIHEVAKGILKDAFDYHLSIEMLYEVYKRRFKSIPETVRAAINAQQQNSANERKGWDIDSLIQMYHEKVYLERMAEPIYVKTTDIEQEIMMDMQRYVKHKVAMNGIVVEVNPSSNYVIGNMKSIFDNQFFQINKLNDEDLPNIMININTDDPIVFNTNISNEIAYLYYGMLYRGVGKSAALEWIERIRKSGMDTSFIRDDVSNYDYINQLKYLITALSDPIYCEEC